MGLGAQITDFIEKNRFSQGCYSMAMDLWCLPGFYNPGNLNVNQTANLKPGRLLELSCDAGYWCPNGLSCKIKCTEGAFCPGATRATKVSYKSGEALSGGARVCRDVTDDYCCAYNTSTEWHDNQTLQEYFKSGHGFAPVAVHLDDPNTAKQYVCPGHGDHNICPAGSYCSDPQQIEKCPKGNFCRQGSTEPKPCPPLARCHRGASIPEQDLGALIVVLLLLCSALFVVALYERRNRVRKQAAIMRKSVAARSRKVGLRLRHFTEGSVNMVRKRLHLGGTAAVGASINRLPSSDGDYEDNDDEELLGTSSAEAPIEEKEFTITFSFKNLGLKLKPKLGGKTILKGVTGEIKSHHVTAVMGPSGAGKTTFMSTLAGKAYYGDRIGEVRLNGKVEPIAKYKKVRA